MVRRNKYNARKTKKDGITFDSGREAQRYLALKLLESKGQIQDLKIKPVYEFVKNGILICKYIPDFEYIENGEKVTEDVKGYSTDVYKLKRNMMKAFFKIDILET